MTLGKLFELKVQGKGETWCPIEEPYVEFGRRTKTPVASWNPEREHGAHAKLSGFLMPHVISREDIAYLGLPCLAHLGACLSDGHTSGTDSLLSRLVSRGDQASVEGAQPAIAAQPESKVALLLSTLRELITNGEMGVNSPGAQVYVEGDKAAVVVPIAVSMARDRLRTRQIVLPTNTHLYNMLRNARLVDADETGRSVRRIRVQGKHGPVSLSALIFPTDKIVPKHILPTLAVTHFEIDAEPVPEAESIGEGQGSLES